MQLKKMGKNIMEVSPVAHIEPGGMSVCSRGYGRRKEDPDTKIEPRSRWTPRRRKRWREESLPQEQNKLQRGRRSV
jgi:hypothetical protein